MIGELALSYNEALQHYADEYFAESGKSRATAREIAIWLIQTDKWEPPHDLMVRQCREDVARAMREQYINNDHGRPVRAKHVARLLQGGQQQHLWADIRTADREFMETALQQRREQIVGDCKQLKFDADYFNDKNPDEEPIQLVFDFTDDVAEAAFDTEYPPRKPR